MNKSTIKFLLTSVLIMGIAVVYGQAAFVPTALFTYDAAGNRLVRKMVTVCVGPGCPPIEATGPVGKPVTQGDTIKSKAQQLVIEAFPNPVEQELTISNREWKENDRATVVVFDINSRIMIKKEFTQAKDNILFKDITPGTYLVQYYLNGAPAEIWKIIKP